MAGNAKKPRTPYDYDITYALISSSTGESISVREAIVQLEFFENIEKAYVTGILTLVDNVNLYNRINFIGTETFDVTIEFPAFNDKNAGSFRKFEKKFVISSLDSSHKSDDMTDVMSFHLVEYDYFVSKSKSISKAYFGTPLKIMNNVIKDANLEVSISAISEPIQEEFRYIAPYESPYKICNFIKNLSVTTDGLPYFLYSTLGDKTALKFKSLEDILTSSSNTSNDDNQQAFTYSVLDTGKQDGTTSPRIGPPSKLKEIDEASRIIEDYAVVHNGDLMSLLERGLFSAELESININQSETQLTTYDIGDALDKVASLYPGNQRKSLYDDQFTNNENFDLVNLLATNLYTDGNSNCYEVSAWDANQKYNLTQRTLTTMMSLSSIDVQMPGFQFFGKDRTIGENIHLQFFSNDIGNLTGDAPSGDIIDKKKSGKYMIYSMRHTFTLEKYFVTATCTKFTDR